MLAVFANDSIHRILNVRRRDYLVTVEMQLRLCLASIPAHLVQRRLGWSALAARHPEGELIKSLPFAHTASFVDPTFKGDLEPSLDPEEISSKFEQWLRKLINCHF